MATLLFIEEQVMRSLITTMTLSLTCDTGEFADGNQNSHSGMVRYSLPY
jgi:hypothetical protein